MHKSAKKLKAGNNRSRWGLTGCLILGLVWGYTGTASSGELPVGDYERKAEFIFNFALFSTWPAESFAIEKEISQAPGAQHFFIGVLGEDPFGIALDQLAGKIVKGRSIVIVRYTDSGKTCVLPARMNSNECPDDFADTQLLFINLPERDHIGPILDRLIGRSVMTVSDMEGFPDAGGMIGFTTINGKLGFQINPGAAQAANIQFELDLANLGEIVSTVSVPSPNPIHIGILPPREVDELLKGIDNGMLYSLESSKDFTFSPAADSLNLKASDGKRFWMPAYKNVHAKPNLAAITDVAQKMNVNAVLMYSTIVGSIKGGIPGDSKIRVFLIDVESDKVYQADVPGIISFWDKGGTLDRLNMSGPVTKVTDKLLDANLDDLTAEPVRVVILPGHRMGMAPLMRKIGGIEEGFFLALESNRGFVATHTTDPDHAEELGLDTLKPDSSADGRIWFSAHKREHAQPNIKAIKDRVKGINAHLALTFSIYGRNSFFGFRIFLIDIRTAQIYQADISRPAYYQGEWDVSWFVEKATNKLLHEVSGEQAKSSASAPP